MHAEMRLFDKPDVFMLSIVHRLTFIITDKGDYKTGRATQKSSCVVEYNNNMGAVD